MASVAVEMKRPEGPSVAFREHLRTSAVEVPSPLSRRELEERAWRTSISIANTGAGANLINSGFAILTNLANFVICAFEGTQRMRNADADQEFFSARNVTDVSMRQEAYKSSIIAMCVFGGMFLVSTLATGAACFWKKRCPQGLDSPRMLVGTTVLGAGMVASGIWAKHANFEEAGFLSIAFGAMILTISVLSTCSIADKIMDLEGIQHELRKRQQ